MPKGTQQVNCPTDKCRGGDAALGFGQFFETFEPPQLQELCIKRGGKVHKTGDTCLGDLFDIGCLCMAEGQHEGRFLIDKGCELLYISHNTPKLCDIPSLAFTII